MEATLKRGDQEREVLLRSKREGGPGQDFMGLLAMLLSVSAMFFRIKVRRPVVSLAPRLSRAATQALAFAGVVLHLSAFAQMRVGDRSLSTLLTNVGVALMAIVMVHMNAAMVPPVKAA